MSKRANTALIGAFVIGALAIAAMAAVIVGSGRFLRSNVKFVCYFQGSVNGLDKGAPVKFRGVPIGVVTDIMLSLGERQGEPRIPVVLEIDKSRLRELGASQELVAAPGMIKKLAREGGLRAQLQQQIVAPPLLERLLLVFQLVLLDRPVTKKSFLADFPS